MRGRLLRRAVFRLSLLSSYAFGADTLGRLIFNENISKALR
jgi:hypothetical protein